MVKTWRVLLSREFAEFVVVRGDLSVVGEALVFSAPWDGSVGTLEQAARTFRVIRDYAECFAVNAEGQPLEPAA